MATVDVARVMDSRPQTDVVKALQGAVPGLTITTGDGGVDVTSTIKIRGTGTLSNDQTSNPLIVVDGVPVDDLSFVNPTTSPTSPSSKMLHPQQSTVHALPSV